MTIEIDQKLLATFDCLLNFKYGKISLEEALDQFCFETGLSRKIAKNFFRQIKRNNVIELTSNSKGSQ